MHTKGRLSTENFISPADKILVSSKAFHIKLKCLHLAHTPHMFSPCRSSPPSFCTYVPGRGHTEWHAVWKQPTASCLSPSTYSLPPFGLLNACLFFETQVHRTWASLDLRLFFTCVDSVLVCSACPVPEPGTHNEFHQSTPLTSIPQSKWRERTTSLILRPQMQYNHCKCLKNEMIFIFSSVPINISCSNYLGKQ